MIGLVFVFTTIIGYSVLYLAFERFIKLSFVFAVLILTLTTNSFIIAEAVVAAVEKRSFYAKLTMEQAIERTLEGILVGVLLVGFACALLPLGSVFNNSLLRVISWGGVLGWATRVVVLLFRNRVPP